MNNPQTNWEDIPRYDWTSWNSSLEYNRNFIYEMTSNLISGLNKKLENILIEALKKKGYEFDNRLDLQNFIKQNIRIEDYQAKHERIYFVNDIPFFIHFYKSNCVPAKTELERGFCMTADLGTYAFL